MRINLICLLFLLEIIIGCEYKDKLKNSVETQRTLSLVKSGEFSGGKVTGSIEPSSDKAQIIKGNGSDVLSSYSLEFPPGSLSIPTNITLEEGIPTNFSDVKKELSISEGDTFSQKGKPVVVTSSAAADLKVPMTISINIPNESSLRLVESSLNYVVRYQIKKNETSKWYSGFIASEDIVKNASEVKFQSKYFGKFELYEVSRKIEKAAISEKEIPEVNLAIREIEISSLDNVMPKSGDVIFLKGKNFHDGLKITIGSTVASNFLVESEESIKLTVPTEVSFGLHQLTIANNISSSKLNLFSRGALTDLPLISLEPKDVCSGIQFYDQTGTKRDGTKSCEKPSIDECTGNGLVGCVTTDTYKSADFSNIVSANIKNGVSVAGITGSFPSNSHPLQGATINTDLSASVLQTAISSASTYEYWDSSGIRYTFTGDSDFTSSNIKSSISLFGITGTLTSSGANCTSDGEIGCLTTSIYKAANTTSLASKIKIGDTVAGISGSYSPDFPDASNVRSSDTTDGLAGSLVDCSANGQSSCVTTTTYKAGDLTNLSAGNIKSGVIIAGQAGDYPSASNPLDGASAVVDLTSATLNIKLGSASSFEFFDSAGNLQIATGDTNLVSNKIKTGYNLFGISGSVVPIPADCSNNGETGCVATTSYKAADLTNLSAGNIRNGVNLAGLVGDYPSFTHRLDGAGADLPLNGALFNARIKSNIVFEYWDEAGQKHTQSGDSDIMGSNILNGIDIFGATGNLSIPVVNDWDLRAGVNIGGTIGKLKVDCKNGAKIGAYDNNLAPAIGGLDKWDTITDFANGGSFPTENPWGSADNICDSSIWEDHSKLADGVTSTTCSISSDQCVYKDKITNIMWSQLLAIDKTNSEAITYCNDITFGSYSDWRLPTQKEVMLAYVHGMISLASPNFIPNTEDLYWTSTTFTGFGSSNVHFEGATGFIESSINNSLIDVICVRQ